MDFNVKNETFDPNRWKATIWISLCGLTCVPEPDDRIPWLAWDISPKYLLLLLASRLKSHVTQTIAEWQLMSPDWQIYIITFTSRRRGAEAFSIWEPFCGSSLTLRVTASLSSSWRHLFLFADWPPSLTEISSILLMPSTCQCACWHSWFTNDYLLSYPNFDQTLCLCC